MIRRSFRAQTRRPFGQYGDLMPFETLQFIYVCVIVGESATFESQYRIPVKPVLASRLANCDYRETKRAYKTISSDRNPAATECTSYVSAGSCRSRIATMVRRSANE